MMYESAVQADIFQAILEVIINKAQVTIRVYHLIHRVRRAYLPRLGNAREVTRLTSPSDPPRPCPSNFCT